jgi:hypothetical protein
VFFWKKGAWPTITIACTSSELAASTRSKKINAKIIKTAQATSSERALILDLLIRAIFRTEFNTPGVQPEAPLGALELVLTAFPNCPPFSGGR